MCFCTVLGQLHGLHITGLDIPSVGGLKPNGRPRRSRVSPYLYVQKNLKNLGYPIEIMDTTKFPWSFADNEFDFIVMWLSLTKQQMDGDSLDLSKRIAELRRITSPGGYWFVSPKTHINRVNKYLLNDKNITMIVG